MLSKYASFHVRKWEIWVQHENQRIWDVSRGTARVSLRCYSTSMGTTARHLYHTINWRPYYSCRRVGEIPASVVHAFPISSLSSSFSSSTSLFPTVVSHSLSFLRTSVRCQSSSSAFHNNNNNNNNNNGGGGDRKEGDGTSSGGARGLAAEQEVVSDQGEGRSSISRHSKSKRRGRTRVSLRNKENAPSTEQSSDTPVLSPTQEESKVVEESRTEKGRRNILYEGGPEAAVSPRKRRKKASMLKPIPPPLPAVEDEGGKSLEVEGDTSSGEAVLVSLPKKRSREKKKRKKEGNTYGMKSMVEAEEVQETEQQIPFRMSTGGLKEESREVEEEEDGLQEGASRPSLQGGKVPTSSSEKMVVAAAHSPGLFSPSASLLSSERHGMEPSLSTSSPSSSPPSTSSNLPDLGIEEGIRFFSNLRPETRTSIREESLLVYNTLTGRMTNDFSPATQLLFKIGFGLNAQRQLVVTDPKKLNRLSEQIRSGQTTFEQLKWPPSLIKKIGSVMRNDRIADPAEAIQQLIKVKINTISLARYSSVVMGREEGAESHVDDGSSLLQGVDQEDIKLNEEQERAIEIALRGHHLYIGGSAGTGKTVLLRILCRRLQSHRLRVAMTATTGVAGCHIGGSTFHHAFGVSSQGDFIRRTGMLDFDVVVIDEISMMSQRLFETFDQVLREEAGTPDLPFGGVQIILCGDFLQLGSINESSVIYSRIFQKCFVKMRLQTIVRQNAYPEFAEDLQLMRRGIVPENLTKKIQQLPPGTMVPAAVNLLPTNKEVHSANEKEMERLNGTPLVLLPETGMTGLRSECTATMLLRTTPKFNEVEFSKHIRSLLQSSLDLPRASLLSVYKMYEDGHAMRVVLPQGESVTWKEAMRERFLELAPLINELDLEATVTEIVPDADGLHTAESEEYLQRQMAKHPIVQPLILKKGCRVLLRSNLSSLFVNGSIGTVVDFVECVRENFPEYLRHESMDNSIERYRVFCLTECAMPIPMVPVVQFHNEKTIPIPPWEFTVGGCPNTQYYSLSSVCIPLTLAYAFTVHKVQGLTLVGRVHLELSKMWPCEHLLYVAMSRVRNPDQLSLSSFQPSMIVANKDCVRFDVQLKDAMALTQEVLKPYPVASWKRCTDTIYQLRRRGSSLRSLIKEAALGAPQQPQQPQQSVGDAATAVAATTVNGSSSSPSGMNSESGIMSAKEGMAGSGEISLIHGDYPSSTNGSSSASFSSLGFSAASSSRSGLVEQHITSSPQDAPPEHQLMVENSVIVARRLRKLISHVERVAKLRAASQKGQEKKTKVALLKEQESKRNAMVEESEEGEDNMDDDDDNDERPLSGVEHF